jgi:flagellar basal-body rod protein FlgG
MPISPTVRAAVSGMVSHKLRLDVIANNVANATTTGFKAGKMSFQDVLNQPHRVGGPDGDVRVGAGVRAAALHPSFVQGAPQPTDSPTDLAIYGDGFFRVRLPDGTEGYTRNGSFRLDAAGQLVTADGLPLVPGVTVPPGEAAGLTVDGDGRVLVERAGAAAPTLLGRIQLARFNNPEGLETISQTLFRVSANSGPAVLGQGNTPGFGQVVSNALEGSNVDLADEMSSLIVAQRAYGLSLKALQTADEMLGLANSMRAR